MYLCKTKFLKIQWYPIDRFNSGTFWCHSLHFLMVLGFSQIGRIVCHHCLNCFLIMILIDRTSSFKSFKEIMNG